MIGEIGDSFDGIKDDKNRVAHLSPEALDNDSGKSVAGVRDSNSHSVAGNQSEVPSESEAPNKLEVPNKSEGLSNVIALSSSGGQTIDMNVIKLSSMLQILYIPYSISL